MAKASDSSEKSTPDTVKVVGSDKPSVFGKLWAHIASTLSAVGGRSRGGHTKLATLLASLTITLVASLLAIGLAKTTPARQAENLFYDLRISLTAKPTTVPMVIVKIDDDALNAMRALHASH